MSGAPATPEGLIVRRPQLQDVPGIRAAHASTMAHDGFGFGFELEELDDEEWIEKVAAEERGTDLPPHLVRATFLIGVVGRDVVARVSVRHELNEALSLYGGHIGYAVVPRVRGRGYATSIARAGLALLAEEGIDVALVTCDLDNAASIAVIDRLGGVLRDEVVTPDGGRGLRFDIPHRLTDDTWPLGPARAPLSSRTQAHVPARGRGLRSASRHDSGCVEVVVRRGVAFLPLVAVLGMLLAACTGGAAGGELPDGPRGSIGVGMKDNFFTREVMRVEVGDTVNWSSAGDTPHNAVAVNGAWSTGLASDDDLESVMQPGDGVSITYDTPGVYDYYCTLHGTSEGGGMAGVLVVGDVDYNPLGDGAPIAAVEEWTGVTRGVPDEYPTIQNAVDAAEPGDLVLVGPAPQDAAHAAPDGAYVYKEQVNVATPYITIRGTDRNEVIVDGELERPNAINVAGADGVAVENLTVRNATINGVFWTGLDGYRGSHLTAYNNGVYGIYAFDATDGLFELSYASGSPDAGFYIGQCDPCEAVIRDVEAEGNGLGYSGTNATGVHIYDSYWHDNAAGIVPNSLDTELLPPVKDVVIAGNLIVDNSSTTAPALKIQDSARGIGVVLGGARGSTVVANRIANHGTAGVAIVPLPDTNIWFSGGNEVRGNVIEGSRWADVLLTGPGLGGDCFSDNELTRTIPAGLQTFHSCDGGPRLPLGSNTSGLMFLAGRFAATEQIGPFPINDWTTAPVPQARTTMPADAPVRPAVGEFAAAVRPLDSFTVPAAAGPVTVSNGVTMSGMPLAAGFFPALFSLYGYLLPFVLLAAWVSLSLWDLARREDLGTGATLGWIAVVLLVPFLGPVAYLLAGRSSIPTYQRLAFVVGGIAAYLVIIGAAAATGGLV